jgi:hypothetical protein
MRGSFRSLPYDPEGVLAGVAASIERGKAADTVAQGCMAEKGYLLVPEAQAAERQAELAAIAAQKRQQEIAANQPPAPTKQKR